MNISELKRVANTFRSFINEDSIKMPDFNYINLFISSDKLTFLGVGSYYKINKVSFVYDFDYSAPEEMLGQIYSVSEREFTTALSHFHSEDTCMTLTQDKIIIVSESQKLKVNINRCKLKQEVIDYFYTFSQDYLLSRNNLSSGTVVDPFQIAKIENQLRLKTENTKYLTVGQMNISTIQFNYITNAMISLGIQGRLPMPVLSHLFQLKDFFGELKVVKEGDKVTFYSSNVYVLIESVDMEISTLETLIFNPVNRFVFQKSELLSTLNLIGSLAKEKTGYFELSDNAIIFKNSATDENQTFSAKIEQEYLFEHTCRSRGTFSFDLDLIKGLLSTLEEDTVNFYLEKDESEESYLLFLLDTLNKNILSLDKHI